MLALRHARHAKAGNQFNPFAQAMADAPGDSTVLLVCADWLDENERPALAAAVRAKTPVLVQRYAKCAACLDAILSVDLDRARPFMMPEPDRGPYRSRKQWVEMVRAALRPFDLPHVTLARAPLWRGSEVELRVPSTDFFIADGRGDVLSLPWGIDTAGMLAASVVCFAALLPRLFPGEPARAVHFDGETFDVPFWRPEIRFGPNP